MDYFEIFLMTALLKLISDFRCCCRPKAAASCISSSQLWISLQAVGFFLFPFHATNPGLLEPGPLAQILEYQLTLFIRSPETPHNPPNSIQSVIQNFKGFLSTYYLLSGSNGHFLGLSFIMAAFIMSLINFYKSVLFFTFWEP